MAVAGTLLMAVNPRRITTRCCFTTPTSSPARRSPISSGLDGQPGAAALQNGGPRSPVFMEDLHAYNTRRHKQNDSAFDNADASVRGFGQPARGYPIHAIPPIRLSAIRSAEFVSP